MERLKDFIDRRAYFLLLGILTLGCVLRLYHINFQSLWIDELYSIIPTDPKNSLGSIIEYCKSDQPPLSFIYLHYVFILFGYNEFVGRVACAVIGLLGILVMYFLGVECKGKQAGLFAALLTAVNYFHIYYSQELRFYSMAFLFSALSYLFFVRAFKQNRILDFAAYTVTTIGLLYIHYFGMIVFFAQGVTFLILLVYKRDTKFIVASIISASIVIAGFSPWLPTIFNGLSEVLPHIKQPKPHFFVQYFYYYTGKDALTTAIFCFCIFHIFKSFKGKTEDEVGIRPIYLIVLAWILVTYLFPYLRSLLVTPMLADRYTIVTLPGCLILIALGWTEVKKSKLRYLLPIVLALSAVINLFFFRHYYTQIDKTQWREVSEFVKQNNQEHNPVYTTYPWHFGFYFRNELVRVNDVATLDLNKTHEFWLLLAHYSETEMETQISAMLTNYSIIERRDFFGSVAVLLKRKI